MVHFHEEPACSLLVEGWYNVACFAAIQDFLGKLAEVLSSLLCIPYIHCVLRCLLHTTVAAD